MKTIIANWKANPTTLDQAKELFSAEVEAAAKYPNIQTIICPPFVFLEELSKLLTTNYSLPTLSLGAQDIFWQKSGPFTGEISTDMLKNFGVTYVLVGHSDRRYILGESDEIINKKVRAALEAEITPVLLVGEREKSDVREDVLVDQLSRDLEGLTADQVSKILIAYEPVWAISTGPNAQPDTPENTLEAVAIIRGILSKNYSLLTTNYPLILYGGSVTEKNAADFLSHPEIGGAVIGAASLREEEFAKILELVSAL
ncbi:MAG: triose-phosphate isomerase [Parcubacteria group bacterium]|nr:triose-phosphate isomerase [Parcubacteria group bacterium]